jgi:hypothetical protein
MKGSTCRAAGRDLLVKVACNVARPNPLHAQPEEPR